MIVLQSVLVAFSMFSALPVPRTEWNEKNMRYALCAFPLVGLCIALLCLAWLKLCVLLALPGLLRGALLCCLPVLVTGGIHLDGYADTCDALASHGDREKKQAILKDPHLGAFAAIRLCVYFLLTLALWCALPDPGPAELAGLFCLPRCLSGLSLVCFPLREGGGLARRFAQSADRARVRAVLAVMALAASAPLLLRGQGLCVIAAGLALLRLRRVSARDFGGLSGDLAGWFLQTAELWMLAAMVLTNYGRTLL